MQRTRVAVCQTGRLGQYVDTWYLLEHTGEDVKVEKVTANQERRIETKKLYSLEEGLKVAPEQALVMIRMTLNPSGATGLTSTQSTLGRH